MVVLSFMRYMKHVAPKTVRPSEDLLYQPIFKLALIDLVLATVLLLDN